MSINSNACNFTIEVTLLKDFLAFSRPCANICVATSIEQGQSTGKFTYQFVSFYYACPIFMVSEGSIIVRCPKNFQDYMLLSSDKYMPPPFPLQMFFFPFSFCMAAWGSTSLSTKDIPIMCCYTASLCQQTTGLHSTTELDTPNAELYRQPIGRFINSSFVGGT